MKKYAGRNIKPSTERTARMMKGRQPHPQPLQPQPLLFIDIPPFVLLHLYIITAAYGNK